MGIARNWDMNTKLRVFYVDDEELVRLTIAALLRAVGVEVLEFARGAEALGVCANDTPHAILLDLDMPDMDGFELGRRLRDQMGAGVRIVALSGRCTDEYRRRAAFAGMNEFLSKPVTTKTLVNALFPQLAFSEGSVVRQ